MINYIFRYFRGTHTYSLIFRGSLALVTNYSNADFIGDIFIWWSTFDYCFSLGSIAISWSSKRQACIALSIYKIKYINYTLAIKKAI